ncbi:chromosomal replication initiator protein DnaA [bacterium]|nr:chromosomal replication initiator protein DnaA [candidate division CSSED10-310 bacterium]
MTKQVKNTSEDLWSRVLKRLRADKRLLSRQMFDTWFKRTRQISLGKNHIVIEVPTALYGQYLKEKYGDLIQELVEAEAEDRMEVTFELADIEDIPPESPLFDGLSQKSKPPLKDEHIRNGRRKSNSLTEDVTPDIFNNNGDSYDESGLQSRFTFDGFVVGSSNQFAHAAARAVAHNPARSYNPLYLHGGVGLGKTHLMHAIGNEIYQRDPTSRILYVESERFTNEVIHHIRFDKMSSFRQKYRHVDVLLIDDIQFIAGKDSTLNEFFHTFNTLFNDSRQIIISSDQPPRMISNLEERISSRFEWGLIADIQPPTLETKVAILQRKAEEENIDLPGDIALIMASRLKSNVRELEGALKNLAARVSLTGKKIDVDAAMEALRPYSSDVDKQITVEMVMKQVAQLFDVKVSGLRSKGRSREIAGPRQVAMYLADKLTGLSLAEIGKKFGGRNHSTVIHACRKIDEEQKNDPELRSRVELLINMLRN